MTDNINTTATGGENITTTGEAGNPTPSAGEKTFTQEQVNAIVRERLAKERTKLDADLTRREAELNQREFNSKAAELLAERGLSMDVLPALNATDIDSLKAAIDALSKAGAVQPTPKGGGGFGHLTPISITGGNDSIRKAMGLNR